MEFSTTSRLLLIGMLLSIVLSGGAVAQNPSAAPDPADSNSYFRVEGMTLGGTMEIHFNSSTARVYTLEYVDELGSSSWTNLSTQTAIFGTGGPDSLRDIDAAPGHRVYRIGVALP